MDHLEEKPLKIIKGTLRRIIRTEIEGTGSPELQIIDILVVEGGFSQTNTLVHC